MDVSSLKKKNNQHRIKTELEPSEQNTQGIPNISIHREIIAHWFLLDGTSGKTATTDKGYRKRIYFIMGILKTFSDRLMGYEKEILESLLAKTCCEIQTRFVKVYIFFGVL